MRSARGRRVRRIGRLGGFALLGALIPASLSAQTSGGLPGSFEISAGGFWATGQALGSSEATLTPNSPGTGRSPLFRTETRLRPGPGVNFRAATFFNGIVGLETGFAYSRPQVSTSISGDPEAAGATVAQERLAEYAIDVAFITHLPGLSGNGGRVMPFVTGGASYVRQLHESEVLLETGRLYHAGGGLKFLFGVRPLQRLKAVGIRVEGRAVLRDGGFDLGDARRLFGVAATSLILLF